MKEGLHQIGDETTLHIHIGTGPTEPAIDVTSDGLTIVNKQVYFVERIDTAVEHPGFAADVTLVERKAVNQEPFFSYAGIPIDSEG